MSIIELIERRANRAHAEAHGLTLIEDLSPAEQKAIHDDMEAKARYVRTAAGVARFKRPIGAIILPRGIGSLDRIRIKDPVFKGFDLVEDRKGNLYDVGKDDSTGKYVALKHNTWDDQVEPQDSLDKALEALNTKLGGGTNSDREEGEKPAPKAKKPAPKEAPAKEGSLDGLTDDDFTSRASAIRRLGRLAGLSYADIESRYGDRLEKGHHSNMVTRRSVNALAQELEKPSSDKKPQGDAPSKGNTSTAEIVDGKFVITTPDGKKHTRTATGKKPYTHALIRKNKEGSGSDSYFVSFASDEGKVRRESRVGAADRAHNEIIELPTTGKDAPKTPEPEKAPEPTKTPPSTLRQERLFQEAHKKFVESGYKDEDAFTKMQEAIERRVSLLRNGALEREVPQDEMRARLERDRAILRDASAQRDGFKDHADAQEAEAKFSKPIRDLESSFKEAHERLRKTSTLADYRAMKANVEKRKELIAGENGLTASTARAVADRIRVDDATVRDWSHLERRATAPKKTPASIGGQDSKERDAFIESHPKLKDVLGYFKPQLRGMSEKNFQAYLTAVEGGKSPNSVGAIMSRVDPSASWNPTTEKWVGQNSKGRPTSPTPTGDTSASDAADAAARDRVQKMKDEERSKGRTNPYTSSLTESQKASVDNLTPGQYAKYMNRRDAGDGHYKALAESNGQADTDRARLDKIRKTRVTGTPDEKVKKFDDLIKALDNFDKTSESGLGPESRKVRSNLAERRANALKAQGDAARAKARQENEDRARQLEEDRETMRQHEAANFERAPFRRASNTFRVNEKILREKNEPERIRNNRLKAMEESIKEREMRLATERYSGNLFERDRTSYQASIDRDKKILEETRAKEASRSKDKPSSSDAPKHTSAFMDTPISTSRDVANEIRDIQDHAKNASHIRREDTARERMKDIDKGIEILKKLQDDKDGPMTARQRRDADTAIKYAQDVKKRLEARFSGDGESSPVTAPDEASDRLRALKETQKGIAQLRKTTKFQADQYDVAKTDEGKKQYANALRQRQAKLSEYQAEIEERSKGLDLSDSDRTGLKRAQNALERIREDIDYALKQEERRKGTQAEQSTNRVAEDAARNQEHRARAERVESQEALRRKYNQNHDSHQGRMYPGIRGHARGEIQRAQEMNKRGESLQSVLEEMANIRRGAEAIMASDSYWVGQKQRDEAADAIDLLDKAVPYIEKLERERRDADDYVPTAGDRAEEEAQRQASERTLREEREARIRADAEDAERREAEVRNRPIVSGGKYDRDALIRALVDDQEIPAVYGPDRPAAQRDFQSTVRTFKPTKEERMEAAVGNSARVANKVKAYDRSARLLQDLYNVYDPDLQPGSSVGDDPIPDSPQRAQARANAAANARAREAAPSTPEPFSRRLSIGNNVIMERNGQREPGRVTGLGPGYARVTFADGTTKDYDPTNGVPLDGQGPNIRKRTYEESGPLNAQERAQEEAVNALVRQRGEALREASEAMSAVDFNDSSPEGEARLQAAWDKIKEAELESNDRLREMDSLYLTSTQRSRLSNTDLSTSGRNSTAGLLLQRLNGIQNRRAPIVKAERERRLKEAEAAGDTLTAIAITKELEAAEMSYALGQSARRQEIKRNWDRRRDQIRKAAEQRSAQQAQGFTPAPTPAPTLERVKGADSTVSLAKMQALKARRARTEKSARDHINVLNGAERDLNRTLERSGDRMPADQRAEVEQALQEVRAARAKAEQNIPLSQRTTLRPSDIPALNEQNSQNRDYREVARNRATAEAQELFNSLPTSIPDGTRYGAQELDRAALANMDDAPSVPALNRAIRALEEQEDTTVDDEIRVLKEARDYLKERADRDRAEFESANTSLFGDDLSIPELAPAMTDRERRRAERERLAEQGRRINEVLDRERANNPAPSTPEAPRPAAPSRSEIATLKERADNALRPFSRLGTRTATAQDRTELRRVRNALVKQLRDYDAAGGGRYRMGIEIQLHQVRRALSGN